MSKIAPSRFLARSGRTFALLGLLGMLLVATPIVQVWRQYGQALSDLQRAQAALNPLQLAAAAQRALLGHRAPAAAVLNGRLELEPLRRRHQRDVDNHLAALASTLQLRNSLLAHAEALAMRADWSALLDQIARAGIRAAESDQAHDLLVEQTLLIADLSADAAGLHGHSASGLHALHAAARAALRVESALGDLARATQGGPPADPTAARVMLQRRAARAMAAAQAALALRSDPALSRSLLDLRAALVTPAKPGSAAEAVELAQAAALDFSTALHRALAAELQQHGEGLRSERALFMSTLAAWAALAAFLLWRTWRRGAGTPLPSTPPAHAAPGGRGGGAAPAESRAPTDQLLHRLRRTEHDTEQRHDQAGPASR